MNRSMMEAIRQQSDDLRDELKELEQWEDEVSRSAEARKARKVPASASGSTVMEPPIRGTVPSIKQAMSEAAKKQGKQLPAEQDPIQLAKEKGNELFRTGKTREAIDAYTQGIELDPKSAPTHILYGNRAMCYIKLNGWEDAERDASMCVQLSRGYAKGYFRRGVARRNLGKLKEARADFESVLALAPNDPSALAELDIVTKKLQAERANATTAAAPKKKIVIEEVDDEDEEDEGGETAEAAGAPAPSPSLPTRSADDDARESRIQTQLKELEEARKASEEARRTEILREEKAREARRRHNSRVEIVEEEEAKPQKPATASPPASVPTRAEESKGTRVAPTTTSEAAHPARHADPTPAAVRAAESPKPSKKTTADLAPAVSARIHALPAKESLKAPQSFPEFERDFSLVEKDEALRNHYVSLMDPSTLGQLFGSSMTPEMLASVLRSVRAMTASDAMQFMKGLGRVSRIGELALFFDEEEERIVADIGELLKSGGAPVAVVISVMKPFTSI